MDSPWPEGSRRLQSLTLTHMPPLPRADDAEALWNYVEGGISRLMLDPSCGIDTQTLIGLYTAVHNFCTSQNSAKPSNSDNAHRGAHLVGEEIYDRLVIWLREYLSALKERAEAFSERSLVQFYVEELAHYTRAARYIHLIFRYLHRHWLKREHDEGRGDRYDTYELHLIEWRDELQGISRTVMDTVKQLEQQRQITLDHGKIRDIVLSFDSLGNQPAYDSRHVVEEGDEATHLLSASATVDDMEDISHLAEEVHRALCLDADNAVELRYLNGHSDDNTVLKLLTNDGALIEVGRRIAETSAIIKMILKDMSNEAASEEILPLPNVNEAVLRKVLQWCEHHQYDVVAPYEDDIDSRKKATDIGEWDEAYMEVEQEMLFEIILAANYLEIKPLLDLGCKTVANMIKGLTPNELRKKFNITNDFTAEEEEQIRRENEWLEDS